jgi:phage terminase large subunit-like protein
LHAAFGISEDGGMTRSKRPNTPPASPPQRTARQRVDDYARAVLAGREPAGPLVRRACQRHLDDCAQQRPKGFTFHEASAIHAIEFIEHWVRLPDTADSVGDPLPFILQPWQAFIVGSLFGWRWTASGYRRFRYAYIEVGKGNGKTPLLAAVGLYGLIMDGQRAPEIYAAAADRDQAMIMYRDAVRMAQASPDLHTRIKYSGANPTHNMAYGLGFFRPFSREQSSKSGTRPHMGLIDELHEHPNPEIVNKMRAGAKGNMDALFAEITNSGSDRTSICFEHHEHSRRVLEGIVQDERQFAYVCALDEDDDPLNDETCWSKVNPNLGISIQPEYLRDQVNAAKHIPSEANTVLRLNFCIWTQQQTRAIDMGLWQKCEPAPPDRELVGVPCYGGLDLGMSDDFSAWVRIWTLPDGRVVVKCRFWLPQAALEAHPDRPYAHWQRSGLIDVTEGNTTDYDVIERQVLADCQGSGVREVAYDKRFAEQMAQHLLGAGVTMVDQAQGFQLTEAIRRKGELIATGKLCHGHHEVLGWMASNYVVRHGLRGDVRPDKEKAADKIDGQVALDMSLAIWVRQPVPTEPKFQMLFVGGRR